MDKLTYTENRKKKQTRVYLGGSKVGIISNSKKGYQYRQKGVTLEKWSSFFSTLNEAKTYVEYCVNESQIR